MRANQIQYIGPNFLNSAFKASIKSFISVDVDFYIQKNILQKFC